MQLRKFQDFLAARTGIAPTAIEVRARELRKSGEIEQLGRGLSARDITTREAVKLLLAIAGNQKPGDVVDDVTLLSNAQCIDMTDIAPGEPLLGKSILIDLLVFLIEDKHGLDEIERIFIYPETLHAEVICHDGNKYVYGQIEKVSEGYRIPKFGMTNLVSQPVWEFRDQHFLDIHRALFPMSGDEIKASKEDFLRRQKAGEFE